MIAAPPPPAKHMSATSLVREVGAISASSEPDASRLTQLREVLDRFVAGARLPRQALWPNTTGRYTRVLLNHPDDDFQIIAVFWPPGARSAVHDHDDSMGAVMPLFGQLSETKYSFEEHDDGRLSLTFCHVETLNPQSFSPITPMCCQQLHDIVNVSYEWAATLHVYLRRIDRFQVYAHDAEGRYRKLPTTLWFDYSEGFRAWDEPDAVPAEDPPSLVGTGRCLCGETRFRFDAPPVAELLCHCTDCQRSTGSAMAPLAFFPAASLQLLSGETRRYDHRNSSGHVVGKEFCAACGTTLFHHSSSSPHLTAVLVGVLEDARSFRPTTNIYVGSSPHWA